MSQQDHELMEAVPAQDQATAVTSPASPPRRDSMEDADSSLTRKRPRLDNGPLELDNRAMSADPAPAPASAPASPASATRAAPAHPQEMTIRSQPPSSSQPPGDSTDPKDATPTMSAADEEDSPPVIAIDDDDDAEAIGDIDLEYIHIEQDDEYYFRQFPYTITLNQGNYTHAARQIAQHISGANPIDGGVIPQLTEWLDTLPFRPSLWRSYFYDRVLFWDEFAGLVHKVLFRRYIFGDSFCLDGETEDEIIYAFFRAYVKFCARLFQADAAMLAEHDHLYEQALLSLKHLRNLNVILRQEKSAVFHLLEKEYQADAADMGNRLLNDFMESPTNGSKHLFDLADAVCSKTTSLLKHNLAIWTTSIISTLGWHLMGLSPAQAPVDRAQFYRNILHYFRVYNEDLQVPGNIVDVGVGKELLGHFATLLTDVCQWDLASAADLAEELLQLGNPGSPTTNALDAEATSRLSAIQQDIEHRAALVTNAWKFKLLRKYVVKGRMELRVMSIGTMDAALVEVWREYSPNTIVTDHAVMQFLADFLLHEQVIEYIISVDSHPQLISRSGNIVGFLVVTHRYSEHQTDVIWNTVAHSQDPRVVSATLTMLRGITGLMEPPALCYLSTKLFDLPIESYSIDILRFLRDISEKLRQKLFDWSITDPKARPWNVCVRLIEDTSPSLTWTKLMSDLHREACDQLRLISPMISQEERNQIYAKCLANVASRSSKATGSIRAINLLCWTGSILDSNFLLQTADATRQILEELCDFVKTESQHGQHPFYSIALDYRLEVLRYLLSRIPEAIPEDLYKNIWDHVIGKSALNNHFRDRAWPKFAEAVKYSPENDFFEQLITSYVPHMEPEYFTSGLFDFVATYRFPLSRQLISTEDGEKELLQIPGADLLWRIILTAPQNTIEDRAAHLLASRYLDNGIHHHISVEELEATHVALVEKCSQELLSAYRALRGQSEVPSTSVDTMDIVLSDSGRQQTELRFSRTLLFETLLVKLIRKRPEFSRTSRSDSKVDVLEPGITFGDVIEILYNDPTSPKSDRATLVIGSDNTLRDLAARICDAIGVTKINMFAAGQKLNQTTNTLSTLRELRLINRSIVMVQKAAGSETRQPLLDSNGSYSVFETAVLDRFDELFNCMDSDDNISSALFDFLAMFPVHERFAEDVTSGKVSSETLFPSGKRFQAQYAAHALLFKLRDQLRKGTLDETFLLKSIQALNQALLNIALPSDLSSAREELQLGNALVQVLLEFLKERPGPEVSSQYFSNEALLVERLWTLTSVALHASDDNALLVHASYGAILEASLHSRAIWEAFTKRNDLPVLHQELLLSDPRTSVREKIAQSIASVCGGDLPSTSPLSAAEAAACFWSIISTILPETVRNPSQSAQLFNIAEQVFRRHDENSRDEEALRSSLLSWSDLLIQYKHEEFVGRDEVDHVVMGFTKLLLCCIPSLKSFKKPLNAGPLIERIFTKFLFVPRIYEVDTAGSELVRLPVLESNTRKELYDLMLALAEDRNSYSTLLKLSASLACDEDTMSTKSYSVERINEIRSSTGYVGLINPRAICYMNSLMTQLFMNVNFRKFMLGLDVADAGVSQRLLAETQKLFGTMQNTFRKAADPRAFAACVKGLDSQPIDINIQMDADEFYNLLFDQWEGQMLSPQTKQSFRSFYGGQTVNQIKSKECEHVSERDESFFVVQCDVQGKGSLQESLQAFVEGDVMEGDNKYKCESCGGKFVDAVKRTCLKDVPDNLIFHLKRFDFDLVEMRRAKINDYFMFPDQIDVSPYKIDHLSDPSKPREEDMFELVGVLVHQGTSENGHYYSYIRERPTSSEDAANWVEFNDRDVDTFDHSTIQYHAFGGWYDEFQRQHKQFSAYMLFYQRKTAIEKDHQEYISSPCCGSPKVPVPAHLQDDISTDNEAFIKDYCLFDPNHSKFVRQILSTLRTVNYGACSEDHQQEGQAIHIVLEHICQTVAHQRTIEQFDELMTQLRKTMMVCPNCCHLALKWLASHDQALTSLILRCPHPKVRSNIRALLTDGLRFLRDQEPALYFGVDNIETDEATQVAPTSGILVEVVQRLRFVAEETWITARGWDDFYLTLCQITSLGTVETAVLLNNEILEFCLKVLTMHVDPQYRILEPDLWRLVEKKKHIFNRMTELVSTLLYQMDIRLKDSGPFAGAIDRMTHYDRTFGKFPPTGMEIQRLSLWDENHRALAAIDRMIETFDSSKTETFYPGLVLKWVLPARNLTFQLQLLKTVIEGLTSVEPGFSDPYVRAALAYCEAGTDSNYVAQVIDAVTKSCLQVRDIGGEAHFHFFNSLYRLENEVILAKNPEGFYDQALLRSRSYVLPLLLYEDEAVRRSTAAHVKVLFETYRADTELDETTLKHKYSSMRRIVSDMNKRLIHDADAGVSKSFMDPLIQTCLVLINLLYTLHTSEEPEMEPFKHPNDVRLITEYQSDVEPRLRIWMMDESTPISAGEAYDQSDYGSESDEGPDLEP